jgi:hypothetical protein
MRKLLLFLLFAASAFSQNTVTVTAANIHNGSSGLLSAGTILFQAVNSSGQNISYQLGATGPSYTSPTICSITNGAINGTCTVANVSVASPQNFCFAVTILNSSNVIVLGGPGSPYQCVQPVAYSSWCSNSICDFDSYYPTIPNAVLVLYLPPPQANSLGGIYASTCPSGYAVGGYNTLGVAQCVTASGGGGAVWGAITGTLANQTDLESALTALAPLVSPTFSGTPMVPTPSLGNNSGLIVNSQWVKAQGYANCTTVVCPNQNNTYGSNTQQLFQVSGATSSLVLGNVFVNPGPTLPPGSAWLLNNSLNGNAHVCYWDGQFSECALTNLDNAGNLSNGTSGTGAIALVNSPIFNTPNIQNATGISLTLQLTTGDLFAMQSGTTTPYIQASPQAGWIKTGYGSDNRYQLSYNGNPFSDFVVNSDTVAGTASATFTGAIPLVVGSVNQTGQTGNIGSTAIYTNAPTGQYQLSLYTNEVPTLCSNVTAGSVIPKVIYADSQGSVTHPLITLSFTTTGTSNANAVYTFWNTATATIDVSAAYTACTTGTGTYDVHFSLLRLQ